MNNIQYLLALHSIDGLGPIRLKALMDYFKDPKLAWEANAGEIRRIGVPQPVADLLVETRKKLDPESYAQSIKDAGIKWLTFYDETYPKLLSQIYDPPIILYYKGEILPEDEKAIAIVGTRKITGYGRIVTEQFTKALTGAGLTIISGLARGVDSVAHKTAVLSGGRTIAVLGGGLKNIYPPENKILAQNIIEGHGAIISEFPPEYPSMPGNFPARNRIISGLSLATLVTEAAKNSGSLITVRLALDQGRDVFVVAPNDLIREGARAVTDAQEILEELGIRQMSNDLNLSEEEKKVLEILENENLHIDEIGRKLSINAAKISALLLKMEIAGYVQNLGSSHYCRLR